MPATPVFDLDQAVDNAMARVTYGIRLAAETHENALANRMVTIRAAWRTRQLVMARDLCGAATPAAYDDVARQLRATVLRHARPIPYKDHTT